MLLPGINLRDETNNSHPRVKFGVLFGRKPKKVDIIESLGFHYSLSKFSELVESKLLQTLSGN